MSGSQEPLNPGGDSVDKDGTLVDLPGFNMQVIREEGRATVVFVFTRDACVGGDLQPEDMVKDPLGEAKKIFVRAQCAESEETMKSGFEDFKKDNPVTMKVYQKVIRDNIKELLRTHGFKASTSKSTDNDEILLKIWLAKDQEVLKTFAHNDGYQVAATDAAYEGMKAEGNFYPGNKAPRLFDGNSVPAYIKYDLSMQPGAVQPFRTIDEIRLVMSHLENFLNIPELVDQKILVRHFYPSSHDEVMSLHQRWGSLSKVLKYPDYVDDDEIRDFFGERIAFFFNWLTFFTHSLTILGVLGLICFTVRMIPAVTLALGITAKGRMVIKMSYCAVSILWAGSFNEAFFANTVRKVQRWGVDEHDNEGVQMPSYDESIVGTATEVFNRRLHSIAWCAFVIWFVVGLSMIEAYKRVQILNDGLDLSATMMALWMKINQFAWSKIAPALVNRQNHRTDTRWYDALTFSIATVHVFITLWPGIQMSFIQKWSGQVCGATKDFVLYKVYKGVFPENTGTTVISGANTTSVELSNTGWADRFVTSGNGVNGTQSCVYGCYPARCNFVGVDHQLECQTNCVVDFQAALQQFFAFQLVFQILFIVIPMFIIRWEIKQQIEKAKAAASQGDGPSTVTLTEVQDHREACAAYEYKSWGGSYIEDFLEMVAAYATLICFGVLSPVMSFVGIICFVAIYRFYAFRFLHVTGRPFPAPCNGIGEWQHIFGYTSKAAVVINAGLVVFVFLPSRDWDPQLQFGLFLALENGILILTRIVTNITIKDEPHDVKLSKDVNAHFASREAKVMKFVGEADHRHPCDSVWQQLKLQRP
jgi:hypothetical protein